MKKHKNLRWLIPALLLSAAAVAVFVFWDTIIIYVMPKSVLSEAVSDACFGLYQRFERDPLNIVLDYVDPAGKQTADVEVLTTDVFFGDIRYDMQLQMQPNRFFGEGVVQHENGSVDLSVYLDKDFMAVSSDDLVQGSYYGITYRTFLQDIRSIPLLSWMVGESVLRNWNDSVLGIQQKIQKEYSVPQLPEFTGNDLQKMILELAVVPAHVEKTTITLRGQLQECYRIAYAVSGQYVQSAVSQLLGTDNSENASVKAVFYLQNKKLLLADVQIEAEDKMQHIQLELGTDISDLPIRITLNSKNGEEEKHTFVQASAFTESGRYCAHWIVVQTDGYSADIYYEWNPETGDMQLSLDEGEALSLNLTETEQGLRIQSEVLSEVYRAVTRQPEDAVKRMSSGSVIIRKGSDFLTPQYKNLNEWSMDDFLILMEGVGGLIGLNFA